MLDNQFMGCWLIVPPIAPSGAQGQENSLPDDGHASFFRFFDHPKNHQKINPSKIFFFSIFEPFWEALCPDFVDFGVQKGVLGGQFSTLFFICFFTLILDHFLQKKQQNKK